MDLAGKGVGALLVHGFGGEPFEMQGLAGLLREAGCAVTVPLLPGHGTSVEDWAATGFADWLGAAEAEYLRLERECRRVFCLGLSMGGSLCLALAQRHRPAGVVAMAAPVFLFRLFPYAASDWRLPLLPLLRHIRPLWPTAPRSAESQAIMPWKGYTERMALYALHSFKQGLKDVRRGLGQVRCPLLVLHAPDDRTTPSENAWEIMRHAGSDCRELHLLPVQEPHSSRHVLTTHAETRPRVERLALDFVERVLAVEEGGAQTR